MTATYIEGVPEGYDYGKAMEKLIRGAHSAISDLRRADQLTEKVEAVYKRGMDSLQQAKDLYVASLSEVLKNDYFNLYVTRGKLSMMRGALGDTESERDDYYDAAEQAFKTAEFLKPLHQNLDLRISRIELSLYRSDNETTSARAAAYLKEAGDFVRVVLHATERKGKSEMSSFLFVTLGRYYLATHRIHPSHTTALAEAQNFFEMALDGCQLSPKRTQLISDIIKRYRAIYLDLAPVIGADNPRACLKPPRAAGDAVFG